MADPLFPLEPLDREPGRPECPFCDRRDTEVLSLFGGQLSVSQAWCRSCRTAFDFVKWESGDDPLPSHESDR